MAPRHILMILLAYLAITETSTSSSNSRSNRRRCRNLPTLIDGQVTRNGWNKIDYVCNTGFRLAVTADCRRGRSWTPRVTCEEIFCNGDPVIANGSLDTVIGSRSVGAEYNFTCDAGSGMGKVICNEFGKWDVDEVECTECVSSMNTRLLFNIRGTGASTAEACASACVGDCVVSVFNGDICNLYPTPTIAASIQPSVQDCINACDANDDCKLLQYTPLNFCILLSTDDLEELTFDSFANYTLLGKTCQL